MKKLLSVLPMLLFSNLTMANPSLDMGNINQAFAMVLSNYQTNKTQMQLQFDEFQTGVINTEKAKVTGFLTAQGDDNSFNLRLLNLEYQNQCGDTPSFNIAIDLATDLVKVLGQDTLNDYADGLSEIALDFISELTQDYGSAVTAKADIINRYYDQQGNTTSIELELSLSVDLSLLPADVYASDIEILGGKMNLKFTQQGITLIANGKMNPEYKRFQKDVVGLKEFLQAMIEKDASTLSDFESFVQPLVSIAEGFANNNMSLWNIIAKLLN